MGAGGSGEGCVGADGECVGGNKSAGSREYTGSSEGTGRGRALVAQGRQQGGTKSTVCPIAVVVLGVQKAAVGLLDLPFIS
jgi:hypothetical protein